jgi:hypothetical protein
MQPKPTSDEPQTVFAYEQRRRALEQREGPLGPGEAQAATPWQYPRLPSSSPWSTSLDEMVGVEPAVDRTEDAAFNREEESSHDQS